MGSSSFDAFVARRVATYDVISRGASRDQSATVGVMDRAELEREIEQLHGSSFGWALSCCGRNRDDAEEVLQDVYVKILDGKARFDGRSSLKTWLFAVIRRTAASRSRRRTLRDLLLAKWAREQVAPAPRNDGQFEVAAILLAALQELA